MKVHADSIDRQILECLPRDGSLSTAQLARQAGLSQSPCWRRPRRVEQTGVIRGRVALVSRRHVRLEVMVFASVELSERGKRAVPEFEDAVAGLDEGVGAERHHRRERRPAGGRHPRHRVLRTPAPRPSAAAADGARGALPDRPEEKKATTERPIRGPAGPAERKSEGD